MERNDLETCIILYLANKQKLSKTIIYKKKKFSVGH
jgi:hypothetical protein